LSVRAIAEEGEGRWIFGYGSLVWRPEFRHDASRPAWIRGWRRRFWQGSTDHRGVPGAPGRVVTLERVDDEPARACWGIGYRVPHDSLESVLARLDHREKGGYDRVEVELHLAADSEECNSHGSSSERAVGLMYIATESNPNYLGPAPLEIIAQQVMDARGPSGPNPEYVSRLAQALTEICPTLDAESEETIALARLLSGEAVDSQGSDAA
jgi:cation transport protein ChaC